MLVRSCESPGRHWSDDLVLPQLYVHISHMVCPSSTKALVRWRWNPSEGRNQHLENSFWFPACPRWHHGIWAADRKGKGTLNGGFDRS